MCKYVSVFFEESVSTLDQLFKHSP